MACGVSVTQGIYDLLNEQLLSCEPDCQYPHVNANLTRGETMQLRASPFGEFYDVLHSDAPAEVLALYPAVLFAGDLEFAGRGRRRSRHQQQPVAMGEHNDDDGDDDGEDDEDVLAALEKAAALPGSALKKVRTASLCIDSDHM